VTRLASLLIVLGLIPVAQALFELNGATLTRSTFFGTPCVVLGIALYLVARIRNRNS
jgi:hypothetical protein